MSINQKPIKTDCLQEKSEPNQIPLDTENDKTASKPVTRKKLSRRLSHAEWIEQKDLEKLKEIRKQTMLRRNSQATWNIQPEKEGDDINSSLRSESGNSSSRMKLRRNLTFDDF